jgi:hypothetical protein
MRSLLVFIESIILVVLAILLIVLLGYICYHTMDIKSITVVFAMAGILILATGVYYVKQAFTVQYENSIARDREYEERFKEEKILRAMEHLERDVYQSIEIHNTYKATINALSPSKNTIFQLSVLVQKMYLIHIGVYEKSLEGQHLASLSDASGEDELYENKTTPVTKELRSFVLSKVFETILCFNPIQKRSIENHIDVNVSKDRGEKNSEASIPKLTLQVPATFGLDFSTFIEMYHYHIYSRKLLASKGFTHETSLKVLDYSFSSNPESIEESVKEFDYDASFQMTTRFLSSDLFSGTYDSNLFEHMLLDLPPNLSAQISPFLRNLYTISKSIANFNAIQDTHELLAFQQKCFDKLRAQLDEHDQLFLFYASFTPYAGNFEKNHSLNKEQLKNFPIEGLVPKEKVSLSILHEFELVRNITMFKHDLLQGFREEFDVCTA